MITLTLNGLSNRAYTLNNFNRTTSFVVDENEKVSVAYFDIANENSAIQNLQDLIGTEITHILIKHDDQNIYLLSNTSAYITSVHEFLSENQIRINVTLNFN